jgi:glyoxylase-like metal-dependent hydrolase (beta-lactamase superfamily II)
MATRSKASIDFRIGSHPAWSLHDGTFSMPLPALARDTPADDLQREFGEIVRADGQLELQVNVLLVRWRGELVLVDAGCGAAYGPQLGFAGDELRALGFSADDITMVLFTHLHLDHVAGAVDSTTRSLRFPRARYLALRDEVNFWAQPTPDLGRTGVPAEQRAAIVRGMHDALTILGPKLEFFSATDELFPGVRAVPLPGHTPFHSGFLFEDAGERFLNAGDAFIDSRLHVKHPEYSPIGDTLPEVAITTRQTLLERRAREDFKLFCAHFPAPGFSPRSPDSSHGSYRSDDPSERALRQA